MAGARQLWSILDSSGKGLRAGKQFTAHTQVLGRDHMLHPNPMGLPLRPLTNDTVEQSLVWWLLGATCRKSSILSDSAVFHLSHKAVGGGGRVKTQENSVTWKTAHTV